MRRNILGARNLPLLLEIWYSFFREAQRPQISVTRHNYCTLGSNRIEPSVKFPQLFLGQHLCNIAPSLSKCEPATGTMMGWALIGEFSGGIISMFIDYLKICYCQCEWMPASRTAHPNIYNHKQQPSRILSELT